MATKKWYESGWFWAAAGGGLLVFLLSRKGSAKTPWDPGSCDPPSAAVVPYINRLKSAVLTALGPGHIGEVCVEHLPTEGLTADEALSITVQVLGAARDKVVMDVALIKDSSDAELASFVKQSME